MKNIIKNTLIGIGMALFIFCMTGIIFDFIYKGSFVLEEYSFTKMVIGSILIGIGFGAPSAIYDKDNLTLPIQSVIHMGSGCIVYTVVAFQVGWIPSGNGIGTCAIVIICQIAIAFVIWLCFLGYNLRLAKKMTRRIQELNR
ncbi:MAG: DUF3021 domain-containing protein [Eubacteriales bacterium]|nr:DUF3021 domain-containing protein [Eubacteriales bacterium]